MQHAQQKNNHTRKNPPHLLGFGLPSWGGETKTPRLPLSSAPAVCRHDSPGGWFGGGKDLKTTRLCTPFDTGRDVHLGPSAKRGGPRSDGRRAGWTKPGDLRDLLGGDVSNPNIDMLKVSHWAMLRSLDGCNMWPSLVLHGFPKLHEQSLALCACVCLAALWAPSPQECDSDCLQSSGKKPFFPLFTSS